MYITPIRPSLNTIHYGKVSFQNSDEKKESVNNNSESNRNKAIKIASTVAGLGLLIAGGVWGYNRIKHNREMRELERICDEVLKKMGKDGTVGVQVDRASNLSSFATMPEQLPIGLPANVKSYSPIAISQRISQYKSNVAKFVEKEAQPTKDRGTVVVLPLEQFERWENAALKLTNVTKQAPSDTYKSLKICLNTFKKRYGLNEREVGFIKEAMNMFVDRTKMAVAAKENVDSRILKKQILPEQLFAEKISSAFVPALEIDNAKVINNLLSEVSKAIDF